MGKTLNKMLISILMTIWILVSVNPAYALVNAGYKELLSSYPKLMLVGDYDNDKLNELLVSFPTPGGIYALDDPIAGLNVGWTEIGLGAPINIVCGDYDNDEKNEVVVAFSSTPPYGGMYTLQNPSATLGGWVEITQYSPSMPGMMVIGDYDGDKEQELIKSHSPIGGMYALEDPTAGYDVGWTELFGGSGNNKMIVGDYDNDGLDELIISFPAPGGIYALDNPTAGAVGWTEIGLGTPNIMVCGDYDNDGKNELVVSFSAPDGGIYALDNPSAGPSGWTEVSWGAPNIMLIADYDNDGKNELVVSTQAFKVFGTGVYALQDTTAGLNLGWEQLNSSAPSIMVCGDYDNDGANELIMSFAPTGGVYSLEDTDGDGVPDDKDNCPHTPSSEVVNDDGCSISQLCPANASYKNHGQYVSCVAHTAGAFLEAGLITEEEKDAIVSAAARSDVGKPRKD